MYRDRSVTAIITAGGRGRRMGSRIPKQFLSVGGKSILEATVEKFYFSPMTDSIVVVVNSDYVEHTKSLMTDRFAKRIDVVAGGESRQESVFNAIKHIERTAADTDIVLVHDGVRPYVSNDIIERVIMASAEAGGAVAVIPPKDTIRSLRGGMLVRDELFCVQTPQGFEAGVLIEAYRKAMADGFSGTDDSSLVERLGAHFDLVDGSYENIKITTPEDLRMENRIGTGFDVHRFAADRKLILGGVEIPYEKGLLGHSDADVLTHAVIDAMLGAAALGDIGRIFPDSDPAYRDISSMDLLMRTWNTVRDRGYSVVNVDATIICEKPGLSPYITRMKENIADVLSIDAGRVSIKATTTEQLGFTGREEGIAAQAVCLLAGAPR